MPDTASLLPLLRAAAGLSAPRISQFENLRIEESRSTADGTTLARLSYSFDQDGHSQYDQTIDFEVQARFHPDLGWSLLSLRITHIGDAAGYAPPQALRQCDRAGAQAVDMPSAPDLTR